MKKKIFCTLFVLVMILVTSACGGDAAPTNQPTTPPAETETPAATEEKGIAPEEPEEVATNSNGKTEQSGTLGNFAVEIKGASLAEDYEGNPAIIITYSWTNNSEETTSVMASMLEQAFQDGVQLDTAIISDAGVYDSDIGMKDIRPGTTIETQCAYVMTSETSIVEFEISEFMSFSDELVFMNFDPTAL